MMISLGILNSFAKERVYHKQFLDVDYYQILIPYIQCRLLKDIRVTALCTFSYLVDCLDDEHIEFLSMSKMELEGVIAGLLEIGQGVDAIHFSEMVFECDEFLEAATNIAHHLGNASLLLELGAIQAVAASVLSHADSNIRVLSLLLMWKLASVAVGTPSFSGDKMDAVRELVSSINPATNEECRLKATLEFETRKEVSPTKPSAGKLSHIISLH